MKSGCFLSLALLSGLTALYHQWFQRIVDPPHVWYVSFAAAVVCWLCIGALQHAWSLRKWIGAVRRCADGFEMHEGQLEAAAGRIELIGDPVIAPLSGKRCAFYEYEIFRVVRHHRKNSSPQTQEIVDFAGIGTAPAVIRTDERSVGLFGFPDLGELTNETVTSEGATQRARELVVGTEWEDCSGLRMFQGFSRMMQALGTSQDVTRRDWRMAAVRDCAWLQSGDVEDASSSYSPKLREKRVSEGREVVAIGPYVAESEGLVTLGVQNAQRIRIYSGTLAEVRRKLQSSRSASFWGAIVFLVLLHLASWGLLEAYRRSTSTQKAWASQFREAVQTDDLAKMRALLDRGFDVNTPLQGNGETALMEVENPQTTTLLIERGADVNRANEDGYTPLMRAVQQNRPEIAKQLIDAKADLNVRSKAYGTTALMVAVDSEREELVQMLRDAGAEDDIVRATNSEAISVDHPTFQLCEEYLAAMHARDGGRLKALSASTRPAKFDDVDWDLWHNTRPETPELLQGFVRGDDATVTVGGNAPRGNPAVWTYQLKLEQGQWRIVRERWHTRGVP
jgi:hypothetical protein